MMWNRFSDRRACVVRHSFAFSQRAKELQQSIVWAEASSFGPVRSRACHRCFLQCEMCMKVDLGCIDRFMSEPQRDDRGIDIGAEQFHCGAVAPISIEIERLLCLGAD